MQIYFLNFYTHDLCLVCSIPCMSAAEHQQKQGRRKRGDYGGGEAIMEDGTEPSKLATKPLSRSRVSARQWKSLLLLLGQVACSRNFPPLCMRDLASLHLTCAAYDMPTVQ